MKKFSLLSVFCLLSLFPLLAYADISLFPAGYWGPLTSCLGVATSNTVGPNTPADIAHTCTTCDLFSTGQRVIYFIMTLTLFVIGPIMILAGGVMMLISAGNPEKFSSGRKMATGALIGILIAFLAFIAVNTLLVTIAKQIPGFSGSGFTINCNAGAPIQAPTNTQGSNSGTNGSNPQGPGPGNTNTQPSGGGTTPLDLGTP